MFLKNEDFMNLNIISETCLNDINIFKNKNKAELIGFILIPYEKKISFYGYSNEDKSKIYIPIFSFVSKKLGYDAKSFEDLIESDIKSIAYKNHIDIKDEFNNYNIEDINEFKDRYISKFLPDVNFDTYAKDYFNTIYLLGPGEMNLYFKFKSNVYKNIFINKIKNLANMQELFDLRFENSPLMIFFK